VDPRETVGRHDGLLNSWLKVKLNTLEATARGTKLLRDGRRRRVERLAAAFRELSVTELDAIATAAATIERVSTAI
jgi:hypothetical protein